MTIFGLERETSLLLYTAVAIVALVVLVARYKLNSFIALILVSLFVGVCAGMSPVAVADAFQQGVGGTLGGIAMVIGLGTVLGKMLAESGGAEQVAQTLIRLFGVRRVDWAMMLIAFLVGIPVFFGVGLVLLIPIVFTVARETGTPLLKLGIPLVAGLSVTHGLVPPHPGPIAAIGLLKADIGLVILYSLIVGFPTAIIAGPLLGKLLARQVPVAATSELAEQLSNRDRKVAPPAFGVTLLTILLPVVLMILGSLVPLVGDESSLLVQVLKFVGHPLVALVIAVLLSFYTFGIARGFSRQQILDFTAESLTPLAAVLLVIAAGGGFSRVLTEAGVGSAIGDLARSAQLSPLLFGYLLAAVIRIAAGSATVAITAAAGALAGQPDVNLELLVVAMGAGSLILSHVNDGGFWLVKEYLNLTVPQTLMTWTVVETVASLVAMGFVLLLDALL